MLLAAALLLAVVALIVAGLAMRRESRTRAELERASGRLARMDAELPKREQETSVPANALRRDIPGLHKLRAEMLSKVLSYQKEFLRQHGNDPGNAQWPLVQRRSWLFTKPKR